MKVVTFQNGEKCGVLLAGGTLTFPGHMADDIQRLINEARAFGAAETKETLRAFLGVDAAIEAESQSIYANLGPQ